MTGESGSNDMPDASPAVEIPAIRRRFFWTTPIILIAILLPILFISDFIMLVDARADRSMCGPNCPRVFETTTALYVYGVLVAGMIGALAWDLRLRMHGPTDEDGHIDPVALAIGLYVGAMAAFLCSVLIPATLLVKSGPSNDLFAPLNQWGLIVMAAGIGYRSRTLFSEFADTLRGAVDISQLLNDPTALRSTVAAGVKAAIALPELVNFSGWLEVEVLSAAGAGLVREGAVKPSAGGVYTLRATIRAGAAQSDATAVTARQILIGGGTEAAQVEFRLLIDYGSTATLEERTLVVPTMRGALSAEFTFRPLRPSTPPPGPAHADEMDRALPIHVTVYQGSTLCRSIDIPQTITSAAE